MSGFPVGFPAALTQVFTLIIGRFGGFRPAHRGTGKGP